MSRLPTVCTCGVAVLFAAACAGPLATLRVDGSAGVAPLVDALATAYRARHPDAPVELASGMGSAARLRAVEAGRIDIAMASHGVDSADIERRGLAMRTIARTAVVFAVHAGVPLTSLTSAQVCDVFAGRVRSWRDLGGPDLAIRPLMRPAGEVDADVAAAGIACLKGLALASDVRVIERPDEMARGIAETPGALGLTSAPMVERSGGRVAALTLDGVPPSVASVASGAYPLTRSAILVFRKDAPPPARRFLEFVASEEGARVIRANGAVPVRSRGVER